ncbi:MAG: hypothetical protein AAF488_03990 [Planctomycetota bacterium]
MTSRVLRSQRVPGRLENGPPSLFLLEPWVLDLRNRAWAAVASSSGNPVAAVRRWGKGSIAIVGDSRFLGNASLEGKWGANRDNIGFLRALIHRDAEESRP